MQDTVNQSEPSLVWHRLMVNVIDRPCVGWFSCLHVVAKDDQQVQKLLDAYASFVGARSIEVEEWYSREPAHPHERIGIQQESGRIYYDETVETPDGDEVWKIRAWWAARFIRWHQKREYRRFNGLLRSGRLLV